MSRSSGWVNSFRALADDLVPVASDHLAKGVVDFEDLAVGIDEDRASHVVLEGEAEALLATSEGLGGNSLGRDAGVVCCPLGAVFADCHQDLRLPVKYERRGETSPNHGVSLRR